MNLYQSTKNEHLLAKAQDVFKLYCASGMTENYANYNWFTRPLWTEPCAVVDSYMLSMSLYLATQHQMYLETANRILYNGIYAAQRPSGGFGCDLCVSSGQDALSALKGSFEASWCCSMRGAEGLASAALYAVLQHSGRILIANYISGAYTVGEHEFAVKSDYPHDGGVCIQFHTVAAPLQLDLYIPENCPLEGVQMTLNGAACEFTHNGRIVSICIHEPATIVLALPLPIVKLPAKQSNGYALWKGALMLGCDARPEDVPQDATWIGESVYPHEGKLLVPICNGITRESDALMARQLRVIFR